MAAANERFRVKLHPTALATDVLFYHVVDGRLGKNDAPSYGTPYHEALPSAPEGFPNHRLVHIAPVPRTPGEERWYFASDRDDQDLYNFEWADADIGHTRFPTVKRTYLLPRADFDPAVQLQGSAMPNLPADRFTGGYVLAGREQGSTGDPILDSLYVSEVRTYVIKSTFDDIDTDSTLGSGVKRSTTHYFRGEVLTGSTTIEAAASDQLNAYWGIQSNGVNHECKQLTANWWVVVTTSSRDSSLESYLLSVPVSIDMQLPDVLQGVMITWNSDHKNGNFSSNDVFVHANTGEFQINANASESANADSSASSQPEVVPSILQPTGRDLSAVAYFFYLKQVGAGVSENAFITKLNSILGLTLPDTVLRWPSFNPVSHEIVLKGQRIGVSAQISASAQVSAQVNGADERNLRSRSVGAGESIDFSTSIGVVRIPPTIHGAIDLTNGGTVAATDSKTATATASVGWGAWTAGLVSTVSGQSVLIPKVDSSVAVGTTSGTHDEQDLDKNAGGLKIVTGSIEGSVYPTSLEATIPSEIPSSGFYITDSSIKPYEVGWFQCYAEILDASVL